MFHIFVLHPTHRNQRKSIGMNVKSIEISKTKGYIGFRNQPLGINIKNKRLECDSHKN